MLGTSSIFVQDIGLTRMKQKTVILPSKITIILAEASCVSDREIKATSILAGRG